VEDEGFDEEAKLVFESGGGGYVLSARTCFEYVFLGNVQAPCKPRTRTGL